jgi:hypothetical protein
MITAKLSALILIAISFVGCAILMANAYRNWSEGKALVYIILIGSAGFLYLILAS